MAPRRGPQRGRGPLALALTAGMVVGLIIAAASFKRPHGSSGGSGGGEAVTAAATTASGAQSGGADVGRLEAQVQQLSKERDAAQAEVAKLRAAANAASSGASAGACPDRHTPWGPSPERDKTYPELAEFLKKVPGAEGSCLWAPADAGACCTTYGSSHTSLSGGAANEGLPLGIGLPFAHCFILSCCSLLLSQVAINNEVLVSVSNSNYAWPGGMLQWWADNAKRAGAGAGVCCADALDWDPLLRAKGCCCLCCGSPRCRRSIPAASVPSCLAAPIHRLRPLEQHPPEQHPPEQHPPEQHPPEQHRLAQQLGELPSPPLCSLLSCRRGEHYGCGAGRRHQDQR